jgi:hypothetical protein
LFVPTMRARRLWQELRDHARAPREPEARPAPEPLSGPRTVADMAAQLAADPEFLQWGAEERAADLVVLTRRAMR